MEQNFVPCMLYGKYFIFYCGTCHMYVVAQCATAKFLHAILLLPGVTGSKSS